ncbi:MAG: isoprenylcysteine carboxylmethyltransferase family protein [Candidatus Hodarchaeota archaeon]
MFEELFFRIGFLIIAFSFLGIRGYYGRKAQPPGQKRTRRERWADQVKHESKALVLFRIIVVYAMIAFIIIWSLIPFLLPSWTQLIVPSWARWAGVIICLLLIGALIWVGVHLGRQVSGSLEIKDRHELVTSGPYKYIRHPMYLVYLIFNLGLLLISMNLILAIIILLGIIVLMVRIPVEENMMIERFGDAYRKYMKRTGRLFPKLQQQEQSEPPPFSEK